MGRIIERHLYDAGGHTGNVYYIRIINRNSKIWNPISKLLKDDGDITWAASAILLVEQGLTGVYPILITHDWRTRDDIAWADYGKLYADLTPEYGVAYADLTDPEKVVVDAQVAQKAAVDAKFDLIKNLPAGTYDVIVYQELSESVGPVNTDNVEKQYEMKHGDIFGF